MANPSPLRIGISRCLLGDPVRYDGGHKRHDQLMKAIGPHVEWVPICPEVEAGLGTPREPMRLTGRPISPRLVTIAGRRDMTQRLRTFSARQVKELRSLSLCGYILKARSPSCGIDDVPLYNRDGAVRRKTSGLFARAIRKTFPLLPMADEEQLADQNACERFLAQVLAYHRRRTMAAKTAIRSATRQPRKLVRGGRRRR